MTRSEHDRRATGSAEPGSAEPRSGRLELDRLDAAGVVDALLDAEERILPAVRAARDEIAAAADLIADRWVTGGRLVLAGAGTAGRLAWSQAAELPGTFGLARDRVVARIAGGLESTDDDEDDLAHAERDAADIAFGPTDVLVAVAASGSTPYTVALADAARSAGAAVVAVVTVTGSLLAGRADVTVETVVGAEALRESTRLGAGTAQKVALDALTTAAAVRLGRVHGDLMVDVVGANAKLRERVARIVAEIAGVPVAVAAEALAECGGDARAAVLRLVQGVEPDEARRRGAATRTLREALARFG